MGLFDSIRALGTSASLRERDAMQRRLAQRQMQIPRIAATTTYPNASTAPRAVGVSNPSLAQLMAKIAKQESGNSYKARNRTSGALGKYQIMPGNLASWGKAAIGRPVSPAEFMANPQLQETIAAHRLGIYLQKYGAAGAAAAWYGGEGALRKSQAARNRKQGAYPSINNYVRQVLGR